MFSAASKFWIVEEARRPGASIASLAMKHGVNSNQLHRWMRLPHLRRDANASTAAPVLLPVTIEAEPSLAVSLKSMTTVTPVPSAAIEIELDGGVILVAAGADAATPLTVLAALRG